MRPTWVLSAPDGPHVGPMNLAIRGVLKKLFLSSVNFSYILQRIWSFTLTIQLQGCTSPWYLQSLRPRTIIASCSITMCGCQKSAELRRACQNSRSTSVKQVTCFLAGKFGDQTDLGRDLYKSQFGQNLEQSTEYPLLVLQTTHVQPSSKWPTLHSIKANVCPWTATAQCVQMKYMLQQATVSYLLNT